MRKDPGIKDWRAERMSDRAFRAMVVIFRVIDLLFPYVGVRSRGFGIQPGMTVVDYGCGPGRYTKRFAKLVGPNGTVYAVDIHELAIAAVERMAAKKGFRNVIPLLAKGYDSGLPDAVADRVCAIDMIFGIQDPEAFLAELRRITKSDGMLIVDSGHERRGVTKKKVVTSGHWTIARSTLDHLECRPV